MKKRGSYFFVLDVFLAGAILVLTLTIIMSSRTNVPEATQQFFVAQDFVDFLGKTELRDVSNPFRIALVEQGMITRTDWKLDQVILGLHYYNYTGGGISPWQEYPVMTNISTIFTESLQEGIIPSQYGFRYVIDKGFERDVIYQRNISVPMDNATLVLSARRMTFIPIGTDDLYGPFITEVTVWS